MPRDPFYATHYICTCLLACCQFANVFQYFITILGPASFPCCRNESLRKQLTRSNQQGKQQSFEKGFLKEHFENCFRLLFKHFYENRVYASESVFNRPFYLHSTSNSDPGVPTLWRSSWLSEEEPWNCGQILSRRRRGSEAENIWPGLLFKPDCYRDGVLSVQRGMWHENKVNSSKY